MLMLLKVAGMDVLEVDIGLVIGSLVTASVERWWCFDQCHARKTGTYRSASEKIDLRQIAFGTAVLLPHPTSNK